VSTIIDQVPVAGDHGWYLSTYWSHEDGFTVDRFTDGDHDEIAEEELPTMDEFERGWRDYYGHVASTGEDPLGQCLARATRRERWSFRFSNSILGPVLVAARRGRTPIDYRDLPAHVREYLTLEGASRQITSLPTWAAFREAVPGVRPHQWLHVTLDGPRPEAARRRETRAIARRALERRAVAS
jgi:hypothetical protein